MKFEWDEGNIEKSWIKQGVSVDETEKEDLLWILRKGKWFHFLNTKET